MSNHFTKITVLFKKDLKDTIRNINVMILLVIPILFACIYTWMNLGEYTGPEYVLFISTLMSMCMIPTSFLSMIIAEEKEKNTMRTLMLSNVSSGDFLASKALVTYLYMQFVNLAIFFITKQPVGDLPRFLLITTLASICMIAIGALAGLLSKDQMSTSIITMPFMLLFLMPPIFSMMNDFFKTIAQYVPTNAMMELYFKSTAQNSTLFNMGVLLTWTVICIGAFYIFFRKNQVDN